MIIRPYNLHVKCKACPERAIIERARSADARVVKESEETFWDGFSGYFTDVDGYYWEVACRPMFEFTDNGALRSKDNA